MILPDSNIYFFVQKLSNQKRRKKVQTYNREEIGLTSVRRMRHRHYATAKSIHESYSQDKSEFLRQARTNPI